MSTLDEQAAELEAEARAFPDERGQILIEAASHWRRAGRLDRARVLIECVVGEGGEDAGYGLVELAELEFGAGNDDAAAAALAVLARAPELHDGHCLGAAELLAERGAGHEALRWFDRLVARLPEEQLAALDGPDGWISLDGNALAQRRDLRQSLGLPPDAVDERVPERPDYERALRDVQQRWGLGEPHVAERRLLIFQRDEHAEAARRWPDHYTGDPEHFRRLELRRRDAAREGVANVTMVPGRVAELVAYAESAGRSPTDSLVRSEYSRTVPHSRTITWPPGRNAPCWCGAGRKYKSCCGRPDL